MTRPTEIVAFLGAMLCASLTPISAQNAAAAQPTWRCGNRYSDQPCQGGQAVEVGDPRSAVDRRAADTATRRDASNANIMERDRLQLERAAAARDRATADANARAKAEQGRAARPTVPAKSTHKRKAGHLPPDYFTAHGANAPAKKPTKAKSE